MTHDQTSAAPPIGGGAADVIGMHAAMDTYRQELGRGIACERTRANATAWLDGRHTAPPPPPPTPHQEGVNDHVGGRDGTDLLGLDPSDQED